MHSCTGVMEVDRIPNESYFELIRKERKAHTLENLCRTCAPNHQVLITDVFVCLQTAYVFGTDLMREHRTCMILASTRMHTHTTRTMLSKASKIDGRKPPRFLVRGTTIPPIIVHSCVPLLLPFVVFSVDAALTSFAILTVMWQRSKACLQFITCPRYLGDGTETVELSTRPNF